MGPLAYPEDVAEHVFLSLMYSRLPLQASGVEHIMCEAWV